MRLMTRSDIDAAAVRLRPHVRRTGLLAVEGLDHVLVKPECHQPTRSSKVRGACNAVARLVEDGWTGPVVAHSSGNHGSGVAYAARRLGLRAFIVLPDTVPAAKLAAVRDLGAEILIVPPAQRASAAESLCARTGGVLIGADDVETMAGAGTMGLEIAVDRSDVAAVLVPVCNGSQLSGVACAIKSVDPAIRVIGVEPELAADGAESFRRGELVSWPIEQTYRTVADGLRAPHLGALAWEHVRRYVDDMITVSDEAILDAVDRLRAGAGLTVEPSGAAAVAACLTGRDRLPPGMSVAVVTGGNVAAGPDPSAADTHREKWSSVR